MVDKKISALDESTALDVADVFAVVDTGSTITKKVTLANAESSLGISGALVTDIANLTAVSGAYVATSGATLVISGNYVTTSGTLVTLSGTGVTVSGAVATHIADNTQAHSDYLLNNANDSTTGSLVAVGYTLTGDNVGSEIGYVGMMVHGSIATPPTASDFPIGTLYVQYTS